MRCTQQLYNEGMLCLSTLSRRRLLIGLIVGTMIIPLLSTRPARAAAALELYGTFHALGVIVTIGSGDDPDLDATASVSYRISGGSYQPGFPLTRVSGTRFVGSLFWLQPGMSYDVQVTFNDPDGGPLNGTSDPEHRFDAHRDSFYPHQARLTT